MNTIKLILLFLISAPAFDATAEIYYGTLRGEKIIELKSPFSGVIENMLTIDGKVNENLSPVKIKSLELESKVEILIIKINTLKSKLSRLMNEYKTAQIHYDKGFISNAELNERKDAISEAEISLQELKIELTALKKTLDMGTPLIANKFLIRQFYTVDKQIVNAGDRIVSVEIVDDFYIDIKFDPVTLKGRLQDKEITVRSLVTGQTAKSAVFKISNPVDNTNTQGSKIASLIVKTDEIDLPQLLDTVFEVEINDRS
ncbi:hypothetical protein QUR06_004183 [Escherichia coli]|nr:hypothetical protein [Escherichia coli]